MTLAALEAALTGEGVMALHTSGAQVRPSQDEIARLAYRFYEIRGRSDGSDIADWLSAEQVLVHHHR
jgi:hypothetical protein